MSVDGFLGRIDHSYLCYSREVGAERGAGVSCGLDYGSCSKK